MEISEVTAMQNYTRTRPFVSRIQKKKKELRTAGSFKSRYSIDFILRGHVHSHGNRYWSTENPRSVREVPMHDLKAGVWCVIRVWTEFNFYFRETICSEHHVRMDVTLLRG